MTGLWYDVVGSQSETRHSVQTLRHFPAFWKFLDELSLLQINQLPILLYF